ncbi:ribonuclease Y [Bacillus safensis FO-36b] [Bacillus safensis subsp. safensis]
MSPTMFTIISILLSLICLVVGYFVRKTIAEAKISGARNMAEQIVEDAKRDAEALKEALLEAKDEIHSFRVEAEQEVRERRNELRKTRKPFTSKRGKS